MAILPSGYKNTKILEITCNDFALTITGNPEDKKSLGLSINKNVVAELLISGEYEAIASVKSTSSKGELIDSKDGIMLPSFYENGEYQVVLISNDDAEYSLIHMDSDLSRSMQQFNNFQVGLIKFESDIGYSSFKILKNGKEILTFVIEVFPSKLNYKDDYNEIIQDINGEISALAFEMLGKTYLNTVLEDTKNQTNGEYINILKFIFDDLEKDIKRICNHFKHNIQTVETIKQVEKSRVTSRRTVDYIRKHPHTLIEDKGGFIPIYEKSYIPTKVVDKRKITTIDIFENRYVKYIISSIIKRLANIEKNINKVYKKESPYSDFLRSKRITLERYLKNYFTEISDLKDKKSMSLVFQMSPGYKEIYKKYNMLKKGLALGEDLYKMTPKKLYKLYEIWCYIKVHHILRDIGYDVKEHGILKYKDNGIYLSLLQEEQAKTIYSNGDNELVLWYNKSYYSLPTTNQRPDTVLCIKSGNDKEERIYIFDAKYRVNVDGNDIGPMEDDINVMHRYRDSIVSKLGDGYQFKYNTFGAYVMFPYGDEKSFVNNKFHKSIEEVNIGAIPMLPGNTALMEEHLRKIVGESLLEAKASRVVQDDLDDYTKFKDRNVMVVTVPSQKHYDEYIKHNFYHIPKRELSKVTLGVKYLAFYKPKGKFDNSEIDNYWVIKDIFEYRRGQCQELECKRGTENEIYLRFELEGFTTIKNIEPIQSKGLISYTTLYLLKNASNVHMLNIKSNFEVKVYKELIAVAKRLGANINKKDEKYYLNKHEIEVFENNKVRIDGKFLPLRSIQYLK